MTPASRHAIPEAALAQHVAVLGKTGSGKTTTAKLAIEQVVADGARVCILDPIKSDWWGLTSSADGKRPGLPFHILGGPRGHVPLHASAGKAIGEIVATGALPLSILDMADFAPGGQAHFFVDFAPVLIRKMRGVVYLVIEEAHLFAPKERSGVGAENMSIHWAKTLATAGRSKGIRLILLTQRTQALHNALLGSCDTVIAHRLTAPADQEPVVKWLKANADKETTDKVASSLSSLPTGTGWLCSGEAKLFERIQFPRPKTYDNTATPTGDSGEHAVKTAPVDPEKLRAIIGHAVVEAEANDPAKLKERIRELEQLAKRQPAAAPSSIAKSDLAAEYRRGRDEGYEAGRASGIDEALRAANAQRKSLTTALHKAVTDTLEDYAVKVADIPSFVPAAKVVQPRPGVRKPALPVEHSNGDGSLSPVQQRVLNALAELEQIGASQPDRELVAFMSGYSHLNSKGFANATGALRSSGMIEYQGRQVALTETGRAAAVPPERPRTPAELQERVIAMLGGAGGRVLKPLVDAYPNAIAREQLAEAAGYGHLNSKGFANAMGRLRSLGFVEYQGRDVVAKPVLFLE